MNIVFRADASIKIGTGHVMRCLALADELKRQGHKCFFICRDHEGHLRDLIVRRGFELHLLAKTQRTATSVDKNMLLAHAEWLGVSPYLDASETCEVLALCKTDWLVVDHYALDACWERQVAEFVDQIMVIDDLADRNHNCSVLLDQNVLGGNARERYETRVNKECELLLGPSYALLRPEYGLLANALPERDGNISRVLVFVGGSDPYHLTERYLEALGAKRFQHLSVDVVIGKNHPSPQAVKQLAAQRALTRLYVGLPSLAALMVRADLMLGAGGTTNWERMCLGLNSVVLSVAENQTEINRQLEAQNLIQFQGHAETLDLEEIHKAIEFALDHPKYNRDQSSAMRTIVDGGGTRRVATILKDIQDRVAS